MNNYNELKETMAQQGYYNASALSRLTGKPVYLIVSSYERVERFGKTWYRDAQNETQHTAKEHPYYGTLYKFLQYGFKKSSPSTLASKKLVSLEIKQVDAKRIRIDFHNEKGDTICCTVSVSNIEEIGC